LQSHGLNPNQGQSLSSAIRKTRFGIRRLFKISGHSKIQINPPVVMPTMTGAHPERPQEKK
jgi:hypothetical protein